MKDRPSEILISESIPSEVAVVQGKVEICGVNTAKLKVLKSEESLELLRRAKA